MKRTTQQWIAYAKQRQRYFCFYQEQVVDLTDFVNKHPGGKKAISNYFYKDITDILFSVYPHKSEQTLAVLGRYVVGSIPDYESHKPQKNSKSPLKHKNNNESKEKKKVGFKNNITEEGGDKEEAEHTKNSQKKSLFFQKKMNEPLQAQAALLNSSPQPRQQKNKSLQLKVSINSISNASQQISQNMSGKVRKNKRQLSGVMHNQDIDEQKPSFIVPVLNVRRMNQL